MARIPSVPQGKCNLIGKGSSTVGNRDTIGVTRLCEREQNLLLFEILFDQARAEIENDDYP